MEFVPPFEQEKPHVPAINTSWKLPLRPLHGPAQTRIQTKAEVLWRTLVADCCENIQPAPMQYGFAFSELLARRIDKDLLMCDVMRCTGPLDDDR